MGDSTYAIPLLIFSIAYLAVITLLLSLISIGNTDSVQSPTIGPTGLSWSNLVTNLSALGAWNILLFSPFLIALAYNLLIILTGFV